MSTASSRSSVSSDESEPDSPAPYCRPWKHLENPASEEWSRGPKELYRYPNLGDFVVLSLDPIASVGHLDAIAKQAAAQIERRKYVALCIQTHGLPLPTKPTHPYDFLFVRRGRPTPRLPDVDTEDSCLAISPNETSVLDQPAVRPVQPLPWDDCYLDMTYGFPRPCRVTSIERDYVPVLPISVPEILRIQDHTQEHLSRIASLRREHGDAWPQSLDLVQLPTSSPLDVPSSKNESMPVQAAASRSEPELPPNLGAETERDANAAADDVSIIESEDGNDGVQQDERAPEPGDEEELNMMLAFESMMNNVGDFRDPVVNVWYDLDVITEIVDPIHFLEDVKRLEIIMDEAEIRLGRRHEMAAVVHPSESERSSLSEDADSQRSVDVPAGAVNGVDSTTDSRPDNHPTHQTKSRGLRINLRSMTSMLLFPASNLVKKLTFARHKKTSSRPVLLIPRDSLLPLSGDGSICLRE
ncbi:unnamed protein product [Peniophora sp. CBMAI 1063]|nr:unnamed protein product [Peniophora sp. CBMAI 1063]